ncbi:MAG: helix-turn-helix domain-containing protein [Lachnospiraceae bacterium]|nr:helix-turn-helix domain-containing protein [Lachnospiraceae bacterium]
MTINERIKFLRKEKGLNQKQFASLLGITQSGASYMEQPGNNVSDSSIKSICTICNVNEEWLRNGIEPIHIEPDTFSLDEFVKQHGATDLELQIIKTYFDLDPDTREMLVDHFRKGLAASAPATVEKEKTVEELEEEYKKTVLNSVSKQGSAAMNTTSDTVERTKNA